MVAEHTSTNTNTNTTTNEPPSVSEADVILPPPSATNPLPSLSAALRLDNREQLLRVLSLSAEGDDNENDNKHSTTTSTTTTSSTKRRRRQLLVFENDALRTLLLRQVLNDPHTTKTTNANKQTNTKKNWENYNTFTYPKSLQSSIVGTRILERSPSRTSLRNYGTAGGTTAAGGGGGGGGGGGTNSAFSIDALDGGATEISLGDPNTSTTMFGSTTSSDMMSDILGDSLSTAGQQVDVVTYFLQTQKVEPTQILASKILKWTSNNNNNNNNNNANTTKRPTIYHRLVYLPQPTAILQQVLVDTGLKAHSSVSIQSLQLDLFPLEPDILSMEYPYAIAEATLEGTPSSFMATCSRALLKLQDITGPIPRIQSLGKLGEQVLHKLCNDTVDEYLQGGATGGGASGATNDSSSPQPIPSNHLALMVLDRQVDLVTPMVTPLTYEGLLDEVVGISTGFLQLPLSTLNPEEDEDNDNDKKKNKEQQQQSKEKKKSNRNKITTLPPPVSLGVHAGDSLFAEVRDQHVEKFGSFLQNQAKALQESHANFTNKGTKKDLNEIHQFVKQIPMFTQNLRSLTNHIHLAEKIKAHTEHAAFREQWTTERSIIEGESSAWEVLEEWICSHESIGKILRALCLQSICNGGLKASRYDHLRSMIVQGYGYEYLLQFHALEQLGWIRRKDTLWMDSASSAFPILRKALILIHAEVDTVEPDDIAYASSGYAPLTARLVQAAVQGWTKTRTQEVLQSLPGRMVDITPTEPPQDLSSYMQNQSAPKESLGEYAKQQQPQQSEKFKPTLLVFFVGGLSYMEVAALRFLSKRPSFPYRIVMVTTQLINGNVLLQQTNPTMTNSL